MRSANSLQISLTFVGISIPNQLKEEEKKNITELNKYARNKVRSYVEPLQQEEVSVRSIDNCFYDHGTVARLSQKITTHFLSQDPEIEVDLSPQ